MKTVQIGFWIENESRDVRQCPGYYAADTEVLRTKPGRYAVKLSFSTGYDIPMPKWLLVSVDADRIEGTTYNGMGGLNFSSQELPRVPKPLSIQTYDYHLNDLVASGQVEMLPGFEGLLTDRIEWAKTLTWGLGILA